jgi:hypothetical protein
MNFFLKILNETRSRQRLKVDGASGGPPYIFVWDGKLRAYRYQPKSQDEVDDLFETVGRTTAYKFAPVSLSAPKDAAAPSPNPQGGDDKFTLDEASVILARQLAAAKVPLTDKVVEQCLDRGIIVTDDDSDEIALRLTAAYDRGALQAHNSLPAVNKRPRSGPAAKPKKTTVKPEPAPSNENPPQASV